MITAKKREHKSTAVMMTLGRLFWLTRYKKTIRAIARKIKASNFGKKEPLIEFAGDGEDGWLYMQARNACSNFAHANRATITHNFINTAEKVLGRPVEADLLYDMPHILVSQEEHYGKDVWVHRNGTSRAYGPERMQDHPVFKDTGVNYRERTNVKSIAPTMTSKNSPSESSTPMSRHMCIATS